MKLLYRYQLRKAYFINGIFGYALFTHIWDSESNRFINVKPDEIGISEAYIFSHQIKHNDEGGFCCEYGEPSQQNKVIIMQDDQFILALMSRLNEENDLYHDNIESYV